MEKQNYQDRIHRVEKTPKVSFLALLFFLLGLLPLYNYFRVPSPQNSLINSAIAVTTPSLLKLLTTGALVAGSFEVFNFLHHHKISVSIGL